MQGALLTAYAQALAGGRLKPDPAQADAAAALQRLADALEAYRANAGSLLSILGLNGSPPAPKGLYLHGAVGRGKSMLMDLFFDTLGYSPKRRLHFDAFMAEAHSAIEAARADKLGDPIPKAAQILASKGLLLCLDEFQVNDIADAMILSRLFRALFERGLVLVTTSNIAPQGLYRNGLNRQLFLPFIALLEQRVDVMELRSAHDYRLDKLVGRKLYFSPLDAAAQDELQEAWELMTSGVPVHHMALDVGGRRFDLARTAAGTVWSTFAELCEQPLGASDYRAIAREFHTLILEGVPVMGPERRNEARRFITLIDALYDTRTHLIVSAADEPDKLYKAGDGSEAFERTASRLTEMRSAAYLAEARPAVLQADAASD